MNYPDRDTQLLDHILQYCRDIEKTVERFGKDFETFKKDKDYINSVSMSLMQIGELAGRFSDEYVQETKTIMDWRAIKNMRNMFAHNYGSMDIERIWETAIDDIPILKEYCSAHL